MNIFFLSDIPVTAARAHCNSHVVKMIVETAQILSTVVRSKLGDKFDPEMGGTVGFYKATHQNHPCTVWAGETRGNFEWLIQLGIALCDEYTYRYGRRHKTEDLFHCMQSGCIEDLNLVGAMTAPPCVVPSHYNTLELPSLERTIAEYRAMYSGPEKRHLMKFTRRAPPDWLKTPEGFVFEEDIKRWVIKGDVNAMREASKTEERSRHTKGVKHGNS